MKFLLRVIFSYVALFPFVSNAAPVHLQFWHSMSGEKSKLMQAFAAEFNALPENKDSLQIDCQYVGDYEEGLNKLRTALIGGIGPNIVQITDVGLRAMVDSQAITPLQDFIDHDPSFPVDQLLPQIRRYYVVDGKLQALPFSTSTPILYYNVDRLKEVGITHAPATYAELEADALKLSDASKRVTGITWPLNSWFLEESMAREGVDFVSPGNGRGSRATEANYTAKESVEFFNLWARMVKNGSFANVGRGWDPAEQSFLAGRSAMLITSTSDIFEVLKQVPFHLATAPIPAAFAQSKGGTVVGGNSLWILKDQAESKKQAAYRFLKFMASETVQEKWHAGTGYFPIRTDTIDRLKKSGFYDRYPQAWTAIEQLRAAPEMTATQGALMGVFPEAREHIATAIEEVLSGSDALESLKRAKAKTDFSLKRYNRGKREEKK